MGGKRVASGTREPHEPFPNGRLLVLTDYDVCLFNQGSHFRLYEQLGAHLVVESGVRGTRFGVWAPGARRVSVIGDFNAWNPDAAPLAPRPDGSGVWEGFVAEVDAGAVYKYRIESAHLPYAVEKADPFAVRTELPPRTASIVWDLGYEWGDREWMATRPHTNDLAAPPSLF